MPVPRRVNLHYIQVPQNWYRYILQWRIHWSDGKYLHPAKDSPRCLLDRKRTIAVCSTGDVGFQKKNHFNSQPFEKDHFWWLEDMAAGGMLLIIFHCLQCLDSPPEGPIYSTRISSSHWQLRGFVVGHFCFWLSVYEPNPGISDIPRFTGFLLLSRESCRSFFSINSWNCNFFNNRTKKTWRTRFQSMKNIGLGECSEVL